MQAVDDEEGDDPLPFVDVSDELRAPPAATGLDARLCTALDAMGIRSLFAVQAATIPWLLRAEAMRLPADLCVCAPTGSGKTLAYALPIVHCLLSRVVCRLRAVVVLPTRSLALQVHSVFAALTAGTNLAVGTALGDVPFALERSRLVSQSKVTHTLGGASLVDILIATPGRLVDQLRAPDGAFGLRHLSWLVVDEADRLMAQAYDQWLPLVLDSARLGSPAAADAPAQSSLADRSRAPPPAATPGVRKLLFSATLTNDAHSLPALQLRAPAYLRIGSGGRFAMPAGLHEEYALCARALKPLYLVAALHRLRARRGAREEVERVLCFTRSVEGAHRLTRLLQQLDVRALEYSSNLQHSARAAALAAFSGAAQGEEAAEAEDGEPFAPDAPSALGCDVLIASDAMARGLDIAGIGHVINYDVPARLSTYMHRAGRTARAGREGTCCTLVTRDQARHFKEMLLQADRHPAAVHLEIAPPQLRRAHQPMADAQAEPLAAEPTQLAAPDEAAAARAAWIRRYERALSSVQAIVELERRGLLQLHQPLPEGTLPLPPEEEDAGAAGEADMPLPSADAADVADAADAVDAADADVPPEQSDELADGPRSELPLRRDRMAHLRKLMREQLSARAQMEGERRKAAKRARRAAQLS